MEKVLKYLTKKNFEYAAIVQGALGIVMVVLYLIVSSSNNLTANLSMVQWLCNLFYLNFIVLLVVFAAHMIRIFYMKKKGKMIYGQASLSATALLMALISFSTVRSLHGLISGDWGMLFTLVYSSATVDIWLLIMAVCQVGCGAALVYQKIKKDKMTPTKA